MTEPNAYDDTDLLNYAIQTGIISLDTMLNDIEDMEKKEILAQHVYAITVTTDKSGKEIYSTYLPQQDGNRLYRRRNTHEELENTIVEFYKALQEEIYIDDVFYEWDTVILVQPKNYIISAIKQRKIRKNRLKMLSHFRNDYCLTTYLTTLELFKK